jgi:hypothetical protein
MLLVMRAMTVYIVTKYHSGSIVTSSSDVTLAPIEKPLSIEFDMINPFEYKYSNLL